jgi:hypothetical protein
LSSTAQLGCSLDLNGPRLRSPSNSHSFFPKMNEAGFIITSRITLSILRPYQFSPMRNHHRFLAHDQSGRMQQ